MMVRWFVARFQSNDTPVHLYDFEMCLTNLLEIPDDLDSKWLLWPYILIEGSLIQRTAEGSVDSHEM